MSVLCARHRLRQRRQSVPRRREVDIASAKHLRQIGGWISDGDLEESAVRGFFERGGGLARGVSDNLNAVQSM